MRGPLFSGAIGSAAVLERVAALVAGGRGPSEPSAEPVVVLSSVWLGEALSRVIPILLVVEPDNLSSAERALRRARKEGRRLEAVVTAEELPLGPASVGALVTEGVGELEEDAGSFVAEVATCLRPGGLFVTLDGTKDLEVETRLSQVLLASAMIGISQERPREGAVVTIGRAPPSGILGSS